MICPASNGCSCATAAIAEISEGVQLAKIGTRARNSSCGMDPPDGPDASIIAPVRVAHAPAVGESPAMMHNGCKQPPAPWESTSMALFLDLLLGHMLGDFLLQPGRLVAAKRDGWRGLLLHTSIVGLTTALATLGTMSRAWLVVSGHARWLDPGVPGGERPG